MKNLSREIRIIIIRGQHTDSKDHLGGGAEEPTVAPKLLTQS